MIATARSLDAVAAFIAVGFFLAGMAAGKAQERRDDRERARMRNAARKAQR